MQQLQKILLLGLLSFIFNHSYVHSNNHPSIKLSNSINEYSEELYVPDKGIPWGMDWLPDGDMLITKRSGELLIIKKGSKETRKVLGLPKLVVGRQGGLLDVLVHPDYAINGWIYFTYTKAGKKGKKSTAVMRAKYKNLMLTQQEDIYIAQTHGEGGVHFGGRLMFGNDGDLYFSIGDRGKRDINPQNINRDAGKIYRIHDDGKIPENNPFVSNHLAKKAIYTFGHRNPQGMAKHPITGEIWTHEHGPRGGDEINILAKGKNYGWPIISYGINYNGTRFTDLTEKEGLEQPLWYWNPSIAPSGMTFVTSDKYPNWQGNLLVGSLKFGYIVMLTLDKNNVVKEEIIIQGLNRVRNIKQGPDGYIYVAADGHGIYRIKSNN